jgi:hypothetical protein
MYDYGSDYGFRLVKELGTKIGDVEGNYSRKKDKLME